MKEIQGGNEMKTVLKAMGTRKKGLPKAVGECAICDVGKTLCPRYLRNEYCDETKCRMAHAGTAAICDAWMKLGRCDRENLMSESFVSVRSGVHYTRGVCLYQHPPFGLLPVPVLFVQCRDTIAKRVIVAIEKVKISNEGYDNGDYALDGQIVKMVRTARKRGTDVVIIVKEKKENPDLCHRILESKWLRFVLNKCCLLTHFCDTIDDLVKNSVISLMKIEGESTRVRVRCFPPDDTLNILSRLEDALNKNRMDSSSSTKICLTLTGHTHILDIIRLFDRWYWSIVEESITCGFPITEVRKDVNKHEKVQTAVICRAQYKLAELYDRQFLVFNGTEICIDIGASPGGWTQHLCKMLESKNCDVPGHVIAIDPASLSPCVDTNYMTHLKLPYEEVGKDLLTTINLIEEKRKERPKINLILCDMNVHPMKAARAVVEMVLLLRRSLFDQASIQLVLTFKCFEKSLEDHLSSIEESISLLRKADFDTSSYRVFHLYTNQPLERTLVGVFNKAMTKS